MKITTIMVFNLDLASLHQCKFIVFLNKVELV